MVAAGGGPRALALRAVLAAAGNRGSAMGGDAGSGSG